jgi:hypothetical protein
MIQPQKRDDHQQHRDRERQRVVEHPGHRLIIRSTAAIGSQS